MNKILKIIQFIKLINLAKYNFIKLIKKQKQEKIIIHFYRISSLNTLKKFFFVC